MQQKALALAISVIWAANTCAAEPTAENTATLPEVAVNAKIEDDGLNPSENTKAYTVKSSESATRLNTSLRDTPQSVSVLTRQVMDDFRLTSVNDALDFTTGIKVERVETDRIYYTARGSDVTNFQIDGIGAPMAEGLTFGDLDTAIYDRIEVLRGANGLLSGTGNPSATVNFVRKRPTDDFRARIDISAGSWNLRRAEADISGPLNEGGNVRGRLVLVNQTRDSYLDRNSSERNVAYGIIEADVTENTRVTLGHTYHQNDSNGVLWGSLPLLDQNGNKRHYSASDSIAPSWSYWNALNNITFAEISHLFNNGWKAKFQVTRKEYTGDATIFYVQQQDNGLQPYIGNYRDTHLELTADAYLSGPFSLGGREHEAVLGSTWSRQTVDETERSANDPVFTDLSIISSYPKPVMTLSGYFTARDIKRSNTYGALKLNVADPLKVTIGANMLTYKLSGSSYAVDEKADAHDKITPYIGAIFDLDKQNSLYASYTGIYNPQTSLDRNLKPIAPVEGKNYEIGIKSTLVENRLNTSFSMFKNVQENIAQQAGRVGGLTVYDGINATTKGYEFDISGQVTDNLNLTGGFTNLVSLKDEDDNNVKPYTPRRIIRLAGAYKVPQVSGLKVGASINWQSDIYTETGVLNSTTFETENVRKIKQDSYAVINLMASYEIDKHWSAALNVYNLTDQKYYTSLMWDQAYYAAPRNAMATLTWKY